MLQFIDQFLISLFKKYGLVFLRFSLGLVFFWFGVLKFFPNTSPAEILATKTINFITMGVIPPTVSIKILALWETIIGIGLLLNRFQRITLFLLWSQMLGAWMPLIIFPQEMFVLFPFVLTLEGQYIVKNVVLIASSFVLAAHVHSIKENHE